MTLVVAVTQMPVLMVVLRSVAEEEKAFALGIQFVISFLGFLDTFPHQFYLVMLSIPRVYCGNLRAKEKRVEDVCCMTSKLLDTSMEDKDLFDRTHKLSHLTLCTYQI